VLIVRIEKHGGRSLAPCADQWWSHTQNLTISS